MMRHSLALMVTGAVLLTATALEAIGGKYGN